MSRDGSTPERQAAQIMAIYPIVKGQKFNQKNAIPPRGSSSEPSARAKETHYNEGDLIDFGEDETPYETQLPYEQNQNEGPLLSHSRKGASEVQSLLDSTGGHAKEGPLIDFHHDVKKNLPVGIKRSESEHESQDEFVDAQG